MQPALCFVHSQPQSMCSAVPHKSLSGLATPLRLDEPDATSTSSKNDRFSHGSGGQDFPEQEEERSGYKAILDFQEVVNDIGADRDA